MDKTYRGTLGVNNGELGKFNFIEFVSQMEAGEGF